jgi:acyl-CoA synthetase (AMP-forming)/AMP-acid ligase II
MLMEASPAHGQGLSYLVGAMVLGGPLGLLDPRDHRQALASLAHPAFGCWRASAHFADVLSRCALTGPPIVPAVCVLGTPIPRAVRDAFRERFGVPLRQAYSSTETGIVAADGGPPDDVRANTVGRPLAGVEIRIDDESTDEPAGRIWVRSPWLMAGYGFPPRVERPGAVDGWWPTRDRGRLGPDGRLTLAGRVDDAIRTRDNRIVDLAHVADHLRAIPEVAEALVIAFDTPAGPSFGAVVECAVTADAVRARLAETLPPWSWPRAIETVSALPRLPNGKPDRRACAALLGEGRA